MMNRRTTIKSLVAAGALATLGACADTSTGQGTANVLRIVTTSPEFSTLLAAVEAAGLTDVLRSDGPITVFAPTNDAFAALPAGTVEELIKPENKEALANIIAYHVVPGSYPAESMLGKRGSLDAANGGKLSINGTGNQSTFVTVNDATVSQANITASNGVIHVVDSVILPK